MWHNCCPTIFWTYRINNLNYLSVQIPERVIEESGGETSEPEVGAEPSLAGQERLGRHLGPAEGGHPGLPLQVPLKSTQGLSLTADPHRGTNLVNLEA